MATNKQFTEFNPRIGSDNKTARVYDVKYFCGRLWVAGDFTRSAASTGPRWSASTRPPARSTSQVNLGISGTASSTAGPTRVTKIAPSPNCKRVVIIGNFTEVAGHERYQVAVLNVSLDRGRVASLAPWYSPFHLRASQPGVGAEPRAAPRCRSASRDVDWAPDGTWWALAGDRRQPGRTRRCATR